MQRILLPDDVVESFLAPFVRQWNGYEVEALRGLGFRPVDFDPEVQVGFLEQFASPFGYDQFAFQFEKRGAFRLRACIGGVAGALSFELLHPLLEADGDMAAAKAWIVQSLSVA